MTTEQIKCKKTLIPTISKRKKVLWIVVWINPSPDFVYGCWGSHSGQTLYWWLHLSGPSPVPWCPFSALIWITWIHTHYRLGHPVLFYILPPRPRVFYHPVNFPLHSKVSSSTAPDWPFFSQFPKCWQEMYGTVPGWSLLLTSSQIGRPAQSLLPEDQFPWADPRTSPKAHCSYREDTW